MKDFSRIPMTCVSRQSLRLFVGCLREATIGDVPRVGNDGGSWKIR